MSKLRVLALGWICLAAACSEPPSVARDPVPLLQTDTVAYPVHEDDVGYRTTVAYRYRNETGDTVYLANCKGDVRPRLEVQRNGKWFDAWTPYGEVCVSPPLLIPPGEAYADTLRVVGAPPGSNLLPAFIFSEIQGVYRLVWDQAYEVYDPEAPDQAQRVPLEHRVSNVFALVR